jgi:hypothetical protein
MNTNTKYLFLAALLLLPSLPSCGCGGDSGDITGSSVPPFVASVGPVSGDIDVALDTQICVTFSRAPASRLRAISCPARPTTSWSRGR